MERNGERRKEEEREKAQKMKEDGGKNKQTDSLARQKAGGSRVVTNRKNDILLNGG